MKNNVRILSKKNDKYFLYSEDKIKISTPLSNDENVVLIPLFFNMHCHLGESEYADINGNDWTIGKYLDYTNGINNQMSSDELEYMWHKSAEKTIKLNLLNGNMAICAGRSAEICQKYKMLNLSGYPLMSGPKLSRFYKEGLSGFEKYKDKYSSAECKVGVLLHSLYLVTPEMLRLAKECLDAGASFISIHVSEDNDTRKKEIAFYHKSPIEVLQEYGLLSTKTILVHGGCLEMDDLKQISLCGASIAICPISNIFLNTQIPNVYILNELNIPWFISSDGLATGRTFSLLKQGQILKEFYPRIPYSRIFDSFTINPKLFWNELKHTETIQIERSQGSALVVNSLANNVDDFFEDIFKNEHHFTTVSYSI